MDYCPKCELWVRGERCPYCGRKTVNIKPPSDDDRERARLSFKQRISLQEQVS